MPGTRKNHFIPCCYSKQWAGDDGRLCEFSRPFHTVVPRRSHPAGTGYSIDIYTEPALPPRQQTYLEDVFLKLVDQQAADALTWVVQGRLEDMPLDLRRGWVRFLMSLLQRSPGKMIDLARRWEVQLDQPDPDLQARYTVLRGSEDPETFQEYMRLHPARVARGRINAIQRAMDLPGVGGHILNMRWAVLTVNDPKYEFLTSDRPIVMTNGLGRKGGHIGLAVDPYRLFIAANESETIRQIAAMPGRELVKICNERVVQQAERQVYGRTDRALRFVERHLRRVPSSTIPSIFKRVT